MSYRQENYQKVKERFRTKRTRAEAEAENRRADLYARSREAREIDHALGQTAMRLFEIACRENSPEKENALRGLRDENLALQTARRDLLAHLGLPGDYTEPRYECALCHDTGETEEGKLCECFRREIVMEEFRSGGIGSLADKQHFDNFSLDYYQGKDRLQMARNFEACRKYAETFCPGQTGNLLLMGQTGLGKTHLSTAIARRVIERGYTVLYESAQNIIGAYEHDRFHAGRGDTEFLADKYEDCELLIIDDLGTEFVTQFTASCLYNLINTRLNRALPTVISTNLTPAQIREGYYDARIASRLLGEYTPLLFTGADVRYQKL